MHVIEFCHDFSLSLFLPLPNISLALPTFSLLSFFPFYHFLTSMFTHLPACLSTCVELDLVVILTSMVPRPAFSHSCCGEFDFVPPRVSCCPRYSDHCQPKFTSDLASSDDIDCCAGSWLEWPQESRKHSIVELEAVWPENCTPVAHKVALRATGTNI